MKMNEYMCKMCWDSRGLWEETKVNFTFVILLSTVAIFTHPSVPPHLSGGANRLFFFTWGCYDNLEKLPLCFYARIQHLFALYIARSLLWPLLLYMDAINCNTDMTQVVDEQKRPNRNFRSNWVLSTQDLDRVLRKSDIETKKIFHCKEAKNQKAGNLAPR